MKRLITISLHYYKLLWVYNLAFTLLATIIVWGYIGVLNAATFFIAKVIGFTSAMGLYYYSSSKSYFYFMNAGYRMRTIFINAAIIDACIYLLIVLSAVILKTCIR
ncbi:hypothetical protein [Mucilaginibacter sp. UYCu711]|uniref:hypothetical protein n=1 Tax=Mucilaginibacter sp. UYCu711 TaxID=3156339 RepID=UPI003D1C0D43